MTIASPATIFRGILVIVIVLTSFTPAAVGGVY
jgi:hypothetical protein